MNKLKDEIMPVISKIWEKGQDWFLQFLNVADHTITKAAFLLKENKKRLHDYLVDREQLLASIKEKQGEVEYLRQEIEQTAMGQTERLLELHEKLELRTDELIQNQQHYFRLQKSLDKTHQTMTTLADEKDNALSERNWLKSEYDHLQMIMKENIAQQEKLTAELDALKEKQATIESKPAELEKEVSFIEAIKEKKEEITRLSEENKLHEAKFKDLEDQLIDKVRLVSELSNQLHSVQTELSQNEQAMMKLEERIHQQREEVEHVRKHSEQLRRERIDLQAKSAEFEKKYRTAKEASYDLEKSLEQLENDYLHSALQSEERIKELEIDLLNEQNNLAIEREMKGTPVEISAKTYRLLAQEYEPRFQTLYKGSSFRSEFFKDFYSLIPSDRLRIEACIANLNHDFDKTMTNVRPNSVKTRSGMTINEYPFGQDRVGRIYFKKENNKVQFYRISRTKNGKGALEQKRVIAWMKANI